MKTSLKSALLPLAALALASAMNVAGATELTVCLMPGSPSQKLDTRLALHVLSAAGQHAVMAKQGIADGDDDGISVKELNHALKTRCDVLAGFPRSTVADASGSGLLFSRPYLHTGFVYFERVDASSDSGATTVATAAPVAATYGTPAQLIAVREKGVALDLENTPEATVAAVASGKARRGIVWYPAVVDYEMTHPGTRFVSHVAQSDYADWGLVFAFDARHAALRDSVDKVLEQLTGNGELMKITNAWALPQSASAEASLRQSAVMGGGRDRVVDARQFALAPIHPGGIAIRTSASTGVAGPAFNKSQIMTGKKLYDANCAKCHGAQLEGNVGPALQGPAFAPEKNSTLTVAGIFGYMQSNMPADKPGQLKPQEYADVMAFLLARNGYAAGNTKMTADKAAKDQSVLTSHAPL